MTPAEILTSKASSIAHIRLWRMAPAKVGIATKVVRLLAERRGVRGAIIHRKYFIVRRIIGTGGQSTSDGPKAIQSSVTGTEVQSIWTSTGRNSFKVGSSQYFTERRGNIRVLEFATLEEETQLKAFTEEATYRRK